MNSADLVARLEHWLEHFVLSPQHEDDLRDAITTIKKLEAWKAEAMEALRPFAAENDISDDAPDDAWLPINSADMHVAHCTVGDLRTARSLVEKEGGR